MSGVGGLTSRLGRGLRAGLIGVVKSYRLLLSPWLGSSCRFHPTCYSAYALQALQEHGASSGSYLTLRRIARCHPGCPGGFDPVPPVGRVGRMADADPSSPCSATGAAQQKTA